MLLLPGRRASLLAIAVLTAVAVFAAAVPATADEAAPASSGRSTAAKRATTSLTNTLPQNTAPAGHDASSSYANGGFLYGPAAQPGMNIGGRLNVGKSHVYVPYYGNISNDPNHPGVQGTAGIAYGFRTWDISVYNGGSFTPGPPPIPGLDTAPKANPALSLSIRF